MKILLFGKNGQLGWELRRSLAPLGEVVALGSSGEAWPCDFGEPARLADTVRALRPQVIVNAAAYTAVDAAEADRDTAQRINAEAPGVLAEAAQALGAMLVHFSSDYVFDGGGLRPWREDDAAAPLNVYGATKLEGERRVARACTRHLVLRTSWVHAPRGANFVHTVLRLARERERITVVDDQVGAPTGADLLADIAAHAIRAVRAQPGLFGLYHAAASGETSWRGYARFLVNLAGGLGAQLRLSADAIEAVTSDDFPAPARRPLNSRLDTSRLQAAFGLAMPDWREGVERTLREILRV